MGNYAKTIIVDDEILIRQGIKHYINWEQEGFLIVGEASNGQEALELIEATNPHIVITDIVMPIMDGEELTKIVKQRYPHIEIIILSSFGEFDYVRSTFQSGVVDYILKPKLEAKSLLETLKSAASKIPEFQFIEKDLDVNLSIGEIINRMLSGYEITYDSKLLLLNTFPYSTYCLIGINLKNIPAIDSAKSSTYLKEKIEKSLQTHLSQVIYYSFTIEDNIIVYLINVNKDEMDEVISLAKKIAESELTIGFALSEEFDDFSKIGDIYEGSLLKLLQYQFYLPDYKLLMKKDLSNVSTKHDNFNLDWFTEEFRRKHFDSAFQYLQGHVSALAACYSMDVFEFKSFFGNIIFNITVLLNNMGSDAKELEDAKYSYFKSINEARSAREVMGLWDRFIGEVNKSIDSIQHRPDNLNMKKIQEYMMEHYAESLTLTQVAKHFHFNPSYLSSYFSSHNNEGFIEFLNKIRIDEASKLLVNGTTPISQISGMVGYSDHSYFCKVFKKMKGLSPSQYRRKQLR